MSFRDRDGFQAIQQLIAGTGNFALVLLGREPSQLGDTAGQYPRAWVRPKGWKEVSRYDPESVSRVVTYRLEIAVDAGNGLECDAELDRLASACQDVIEGSSLGGNVIPEWNLLDEGTYSETATYPERSVMLSGTFTYLIEVEESGS